MAVITFFPLYGSVRRIPCQCCMLLLLPHCALEIRPSYFLCSQFLPSPLLLLHHCHTTNIHSLLPITPAGIKGSKAPLPLSVTGHGAQARRMHAFLKSLYIDLNSQSNNGKQLHCVFHCSKPRNHQLCFTQVSHYQRLQLTDYLISKPPSILY